MINPLTHLPYDIKPIISVKDIGKSYLIFDKPIDRLKHSMFWRLGKRYGKEFWALHNVSFDVNRGEAIGILGRNGSGKSTLLQIISGVLQPTAGEIYVSGRISALLELGSGFNMEYSGKENIYLSGAILGIERDDMRQRYDDIVSFADIGEYINQPVKTYSSGMFARLAFSVAISVDPDILIVDEILAVGDYGFQQKCISRMRKMRDAGLTLLFVSHSPDAIKNTCTKGLFLMQGQTAYWGSAEEAVNLYFRYVRELANIDALNVQTDLSKPREFISNVPGKLRYGTGHVQIEKVVVENDNGEPCGAFVLNEYINIKVNINTLIPVENLSVSFLIRDMTAVDLMGTTTFDEGVKFPKLGIGERIIVKFRFKNQLRPGNFGISMAVNRVALKDYSDNVLFDQIDAVATFVVIQTPERPVHYKFSCPVDIDYKLLN